MKKRTAMALWIFVFSITGLPLQAQYYYYNDKYFDKALVVEAGCSAGIMNSFTDLGGKKGRGKHFIKDLNWRNSKPSFSLYSMVMYKYRLGIKLEASFGTVQGADSLLKPVAASAFGRYERNLSFKSNITDLQLALEIHPLFFREYGEDEAPRLSPYVIAGIGFFSFEPMAQLHGQWYSLQPLHTEGQGFAGYNNPYKLRQLNFPLGIGIRYEISSLLSARLEIVHRILQTDYLDDVSKDYVSPGLFVDLPFNRVAIARQLFDRQAELNSSHITQVGSQRGDPTHNDAYFSIQLKLGINLGRQRR
jgi:hypothetical protein